MNRKYDAEKSELTSVVLFIQQKQLPYFFGGKTYHKGRHNFPEN
jgi:hypothetical protein